MAEYLIQSETLDDIADAINAKTGGTDAMTPAEMAAAIGAIKVQYPYPVAALKTGSFTLAEDVTTYTITHNLSRTPQLVFVWCKGFTRDVKDLNKSKTRMIVMSQIGSINNSVNWMCVYSSTTTGGNVQNTVYAFKDNDVTYQIAKLHNCGTLGSTLTTTNGTETAEWCWAAVSFYGG